jgi:uncharacterized protein YgbK (DUF1537 family)
MGSHPPEATGTTQWRGHMAEVNRRDFLSGLGLTVGASLAALPGLPSVGVAHAQSPVKGNIPDTPYKIGHMTFFTGPAAVLAGSCSVATQGQVADMKRNHDAFVLDPVAIAAGRDQAQEALAWAAQRGSDKPILIYSTAAPDQVSAIQEKLGREAAGVLIEQTLGRIAQGLVAKGVRRLVVAGGETSGAVVGALGVQGLYIGPEIDPGVPWTFSIGSPTLALALKSGNFGTPDFFTKAFRVQP